jgi:hypothetical protein
MASLFGDPSVASASAGYTGPYLAYFAGQQQAPGGGPVQFLVCRAGVTRGTKAVLDGSSGTTMTLSAVGAYAGSASQYLQVTLTVGGGKIQTISFSDSRTSAPVGTPLADSAVGGAYDLSSNAKAVAAINATNPLTSLGSVCVATTGASSVVPAALTNSAFGTGTDGKGAAYNDATIGTSGSGGLLDQSLWTPADYIVAGYDANQIGAVLLSHINAALSMNNYRKAVLGPAALTTFATLTGGSYVTSGLQSSRLVFLGHDALWAPHPATGTLTTWDGFYGAAALAGLKASAPTQETIINYRVGGFNAPAPPTDKAAGLTYSDLNTLAGAGFTVLYSSPQDPALRVRDTLSTAPQTINGTSQVNQFSYWNVQDIDDAVSRATVSALAPFKGRPMDRPAVTAQLMLAAVQRSINQLGPVTNGLNGDGTHFEQDPASGNITGTVSYRTRLGIRQIPVSIGFTAV